MSSFLRLRLTFKNFELDLGKSCWFLLDKKECRRISDLQVLIKEKLGLSHGLRCFLKKTVVPERESIELIRDEDEISIEGIFDHITSSEVIANGIGDKSIEEEPDHCGSKKKKKKKKKGNDEAQKNNSVLFYSEENTKKTIKNKRKHESSPEVSKPSKKAKVDVLIEEELETDGSDVVKTKGKKKKKSKSKWDLKELDEVQSKFKQRLDVVISDRRVEGEKVVSKSTSKRNKNAKKEREQDLKCLDTEKNDNYSDKNKVEKKIKKKNKEKKEMRKVNFENESTVNELPKAQLPKTPHVNLKRKKETENVKRNLENGVKNMKTDKSMFDNADKSNQRSFQILSSVTTNLKATPKVRCNPNGSHIYFGSGDESSLEDLSQEAANMVCDFQGSSSKALKEMAQNDKQTNFSSFYAFGSQQKDPPIVNNSLSPEKTNVKMQSTVNMTPKESKTCIGGKKITENENANNHEKAKKNYSSCQPLQSTPRIGDKIAFKILELSFSYTPEVSDYKEAEVLSFDNSTNIAKLCLAADSIKERPEEGVFRKFELPSDDDDDTEKDDPRFVDVNWKEVIAPVLL